MGFDGLLVTEIFHSLQGETSLSGMRFAFVRLTGCNLRCTYCDSAYAFKGGRKMSIEQILEVVRGYDVRHVLLTGGEPLLQRQSPALVDALVRAGYAVSIETHGEVSIEPVAQRARIVMDIKTPASGMSHDTPGVTAGTRGRWRDNLRFLKAGDEIKFVVASEADYAWARDIIRGTRVPAGVDWLLSPAQVAPGQPGRFAGVEPRWLAERIIEDRLNSRFQLQLHKQLWGNKTGV